MPITVQNTYTTTSATSIGGVVHDGSTTKLVAIIVYRDATTADREVTAVSRNSQNFTKAVAADNASTNSVDIWYLDNPTGTGTAAVSVTSAGAIGFAAMAVLALAGTATGASSIEDTETSTTNSATPSLTLTTTNGSLVVEGVSFNNTYTHSFSNSQTSIRNESGTYRRVIARVTASGTSTTVGHNHTTSTALAHAAISIKEVFANADAAVAAATATAHRAIPKDALGAELVTLPNALAYNTGTRVNHDTDLVTGTATSLQALARPSLPATPASTLAAAFDTAHVSVGQEAGTTSIVSAAYDVVGTITTEAPFVTVDAAAHIAIIHVDNVVQSVAATATAHDPTTQQDASATRDAELVTANSTAHDATVLEGAIIAELTTGTIVAYPATIISSTAPFTGSAAGVAFDTERRVLLPTGVAAAAGSAYAPGVNSSQTAETAAGTGTAQQPTISIASANIIAGVAAATATAHNVGNNVTAPAETASATSTAHGFTAEWSTCVYPGVAQANARAITLANTAGSAARVHRRLRRRRRWRG